MKKKRSRSRSRSLSRLGVVVVLLVFCAASYVGWNLFNSARGNTFDVRIENKASKNFNDKYISIDVYVENNTHAKKYHFPWGNCAEKQDYVVDGVSKNPLSKDTATCAIGYPPFNPGQSVHRTQTYDPTDLKPGKHTLQLIINGVKSNELTLDITKGGTKIADCYKYTEELTPHCANLKLEAAYNGSSGDRGTDAHRCRLIKENLIDGSSLHVIPMPGKNSLKCDSNLPVYFVANIPFSDVKVWKKRIKAYNHKRHYLFYVAPGYFIKYPKL